MPIISDDSDKSYPIGVPHARFECLQIDYLFIYVFTWCSVDIQYDYFLCYWFSRNHIVSAGRSRIWVDHNCFFSIRQHRAHWINKQKRRQAEAIKMVWISSLNGMAHTFKTYIPLKVKHVVRHTRTSQISHYARRSFTQLNISRTLDSSLARYFASCGTDFSICDSTDVVLHSKIIVSLVLSPAAVFCHSIRQSLRLWWLLGTKSWCDTVGRACRC